MRDARTMTAALAVMMAAVALFACGGGSKEKANDAEAPKAQSEAAPPAPEQANPAQPAAVPAEPEHYDPASAAGAVKGIPAPTNTGGIEAVANYFAEVPGFDLAPLGEHGREKFLHRINSELCTCGCKNETIAWCLVNDPKCPSVKGLAQTVFDEVKKGS